MDNEDTPVLDFVKAVSDPDRLRIIGLLARGDATTRQLADQLGTPFRQVFNHLGLLEFAGIVHRSGELFSLDETALERLPMGQFPQPREKYIPARDLDANTRKVLTAYLNADGSLKHFPAQSSRQRIILDYLTAAFEPGRVYSEKEVNAILRRFHPDTATIRRALVEAALLAREADGSKYWRVESRE